MSPTDRPHLSVVINDARQTDMPRYDGGAVTERPYERHEPLPVDVTPAIAQAWRTATARCVPGALGIALTCQAYLTQLEVERHFSGRSEQVLRELDEVARHTRVGTVAAGPRSDYLRAILGMSPDVNESSPQGNLLVPVPMRLIGTITDELATEAVLSTSLDRAIAWEIAAVARGRSIGEWAAWALVDQQVDRRPSTA